MYARMTTMQKAGAIDSAAMKDSIKRWREITEAQMKEGGKGGLLLFDRSTNTATSISMWETEAAINASEAAHK